MARPHIVIVVAAYNEEKRIAAVINDLRTHRYTDIIVVDDCSKDKTGVVARKAGATVIRHRINQGQGAALRTGIRAALKRKANIIITFDGDGQHRAAEIKRLVAPIARGEADIALGSRFLGKARDIPWYKLVTLKGSILVERVLLGVRLTDVHNGFRALSTAAARKIRIGQDRMAHASEIVYEIKLRKLRYVEVPVTIVYDEYSRARGQSIFNAFRILRDIIRMKRTKG